MTLDEINAMLKTSGLPVTYRAWPAKQAPELPYLCYLTDYTDNFPADGVVYHPIKHLQVELYTREKNPQAESAVEAALAGVFWQKSEEYLDSEQCYEIIYEFEV